MSDEEREKSASVYKLMPTSGGLHAARAGAVQWAIDSLGLEDPEVHSVVPMGPWLHVRVIGFPPPRSGLDMAGMLTESRAPRKRRVRRKK